jgi:DtxR family Mn-dependent transcriptional regulator
MRLPSRLLECLDAIYRLGRERAAVTPRALARRLAVDQPEVSERLIALGDQGLVHDDGGAIALTAAGERVALGLLRTHRLLECFLADTLKLPWDRVHEEALRLTPVVSADVVEALAGHLGDPATCPHGNPIPDAGGTVRGDDALPLCRLSSGDTATIVRIEREEPATLRHLAALGLLPGTRIEVQDVAPLGGPILVRVGSAAYALGRKVAACILVRASR